MPKDIEFVQIEAQEDEASVRDRLSFLRGKNVLLIWPEEGTALTRKLDLVLVQREAMRRAIRLAIVSHDSQVIKHANELNISTFETIGASQRGRWKRGRTKVSTRRHHKPKDELEPEQLMDVASRVNAESRFMVPSLFRVVIWLLVLFAIGAILYLILPSAEVTIQLNEELIVVESTIIADPQATVVDLENGVVPARLQAIEIQETGQRETTGSQDLPDTFASGTVVIINESDEEILIPAGTIVRTSSSTPVRFITTIEATLPAGEGEQVDIPIEAAAESSGIVGNVEAGTINTIETEWADNVTVTNLTPTGGGESRSLPVVSQADIDNLRGTVRQQLFTRALIEMETFISDSEFLIEETLRITDEREDWIEFSAQVGDVVDTVSMSMRAIIDAVVVNQMLGERVVFAALSREIRGRLIKPDSIEYVRGGVSSIDENDRVTFTMTGSVTVVPDIDVNQISERIAGMSVDEAQAYLSANLDLKDGTQPQIQLNNSWNNSLPQLPMRITVRLADDADE